MLWKNPTSRYSSSPKQGPRCQGGWYDVVSRSYPRWYRGILKSRKLEAGRADAARQALADDADQGWRKHLYHGRLKQAWKSSNKNMGYAVVEAHAHGIHSIVNCGGVQHESMEDSRQQWTHNQPDKRWCVHEDSLQIRALVTSEELTLPRCLQSQQFIHHTEGHV